MAKRVGTESQVLGGGVEGGSFGHDCTHHQVNKPAMGSAGQK